jgi:hypothetical protein
MLLTIQQKLTKTSSLLYGQSLLLLLQQWKRRWLGFVTQLLISSGFSHPVCLFATMLMPNSACINKLEYIQQARHQNVITIVDKAHLLKRETLEEIRFMQKEQSIFLPIKQLMKSIPIQPEQPEQSTRFACILC